jgi:hypothetical protein
LNLVLYRPLRKRLIMNQGRMAFTQIMDFASQDIFKVCVKRYKEQVEKVSAYGGGYSVSYSGMVEARC